MAEVPCLLLAAGGSSRMGNPKPLLPWGDRTLIEYQAGLLLETGQAVAVVLGSDADEILPLLDQSPVECFINKAWAQGMGSSIRCGIEGIIRTFPDAAGVMVALVDQPLVSLSHYKKMTALFQAGSQQILVSRDRSGLQGVPVLFDRAYFESLRSLKGDEGAKSVIRQHPRHVQYVPCDGLLDDMDTGEDYLRLLDLFAAF